MRVCSAMASVAALLMSTIGALAGCHEDPRRMTINDQTVQLRGFLCSAGEGTAEVRLKVELFQFSDIAASLLVARKSSDYLRETIGTPKVIDNEVLKAYSELLKNFGRTTDDTSIEFFSFSLSAPNVGAAVASEDKSGRRFRTLTALGGGDKWTYQFPAAAEIRSLRSKTMPEELNIYYSVGVGCEDFSDKQVCKKYEKTSVRTIFWRGMRAVRRWEPA
jgi:hypothetical protein